MKAIKPKLNSAPSQVYSHLKKYLLFCGFSKSTYKQILNKGIRRYAIELQIYLNTHDLSPFT